MKFAVTSTFVAGSGFSAGYPQCTPLGCRLRQIFPTLRNPENCYSDLTSSRSMNQNKQPKPNRLDIYRRRMKFSRRQVARLLGDQGIARISEYERGERLPGLLNALRLGIILRVPVEFLFYSLHDSLRAQIRAEEERCGAQPIQGTLF